VTEADVADLTLELPARSENVGIVRQAVAGLAESAGADPERIGDVKAAVTEACMNVVVHAYPDEEGPLEVVATASEQELAVEVRDQGAGIKPNPLEPDGISLRLGLPLIGALSDQFEINGGAGRGTTVRIVFDLSGTDREERAADEPLSTTAGTTLQVHGPGAGTATARVIALLAARADFNVDRISDVQILADSLSAVAPVGKPMRIAIAERDGGLELRLGPLEAGAGRQMLDRAQLPEVGSVIERVADKLAIEPEPSGQGGEYLVLQLGGHR
jgi:serine/threonine-protein kinase RsbW